MLQTIKIGNYVQVQGLLVRKLANGKIIVSDGDKKFEGTPVNRLN